MDKIKLAQRTIAMLSSMIESGECHTARSREMMSNAQDALQQLTPSRVCNRVNGFDNNRCINCGVKVGHPCEYEANEIRKRAMGIVNQLFDLVEVSAKKRQEINDKANEYMIEQLTDRKLTKHVDLTSKIQDILSKKYGHTFDGMWFENGTLFKNIINATEEALGMPNI